MASMIPANCGWTVQASLPSDDHKWSHPVRLALLAFLLLLPLQAARGESLWQTLPPTPAPVPGEHTGHAKVNGISLYYATIGHGSPVVLLHGGLSNSDYWGNQIKALAPRHTVIVMDSRGPPEPPRDRLRV